MRDSFPLRPIFTTASLLAAVLGAGGARAATLTWDAGGGATTTATATDGGGNWSTSLPARWNNNTTDLIWNNATNDTAVIGNGNGAAGTITLTTGITAGGLTFNAPGSGNYTVTGNTLTLSGTPTITANASATIASALSVAGTLGKAGTGTLTLSGGAGLARFDINGGGVAVTGGAYTTGSYLTMTGTSAYTQTGGSVTVASGFGFYVGNAGLSTTVATISGGSLTTLNEYVRLGTSNSSGSGTSTFNISNTGTVTTGAAQGVTAQNTGASTTSTVNLGDGLNFTGGANIAAGGTSGVLSVGLINKSTGGFNFNFNGGTLRALSGNATFVSGLTSVNVQDAGGVVDNNGFAIGITNGLLHGGVAPTDGGMVFKGSGTTSLSGVNTYNGATLINAGTLQIGGSGSLGSGTYAGAIANNGALKYSSSASQTLSGVISGTGSLTKDTSAAVLTLSGANTHTGATTVNVGTLSVSTIGNGGVSGNLGAATSAASNLVLGGGTLQYTGATASTDRAFTLANGTTSTIDVTAAGTTLTMTGAAAATSGNLFKVGAGTLALTGANAFTGFVQITGGVLSVSSVAGLGNGTGASYIAVQSGSTLRYTGTGSETTTARDLYWNNFAATIDIASASANLTFDITGGTRDQVFTKTGAGQLTLKKSTAISEFSNNAFNITGGTVEFAQNNAGAITYFNGVVTGAAGTLIKVSGTGKIGSGGAANWNANLAGLDIGSSASFGLRSANLTIDALNGGGALYQGYSAATNTVTLGVNNAVGATFSGIIHGNGTSGTEEAIERGVLALVKTGNGTQALTGANTYTGGTTITAGTLSFANGSLGPSGAITMNGGVLQWNGTNTQDVSSRITMVNAKTATFDTNGNNVSFASAIGGGTSGALTKTGTGTLTLSGTNAYTGATTVNNGALLVNGTHNAGTGNYAVNSGGTLGGRGTITTTGTVTVAGGGQITGGAVGGVDAVDANNILRITTSTLALNGTYLADINYAGISGNQADGDKADMIRVTGNVAFNATTGTGSKLKLSGTNTAPAQGTHYAIKLLEWTGTAAGATSDWNAANITGLQAGQSVVRWGNAYYLVPEPASFALLAMGSLLLLRRPSRRRKGAASFG